MPGAVVIQLMKVAQSGAGYHLLALDGIINKNGQWLKVLALHFMQRMAQRKSLAFGNRLRLFALQETAEGAVDRVYGRAKFQLERAA